MGDPDHQPRDGAGPAPLSRLRDPIRVACIVAAIAFAAATDLGVLWNDIIRSSDIYSDFDFIWMGGRLDEPYAKVEDLAFAYPPTSLLLIKPFAQLPFAAALVAWSVLGTLALLVAAKHLTDWRIAMLAVLTPSWFVAMLTGQTSLFVAALAIAGILAKPPVAAGLCFALAGAIKPQAMVALPIALLAAREWRTIGWTGAWAAGLILSSALLWGQQMWVDWFAALPKFQQELIDRDIIQQSVGMHALGLRFGLPLYWPGVALGVVAVWQAFRRTDRIDRYVALVCGAALISPYMLHYDLAGLGAAGIAILADRRRPVLAWLGAALAITYVLAPFGIVLLAASLLTAKPPGVRADAVS